jgi:zinc/manganese transport system permease protein
MLFATLHTVLIAPFADYGFMRRALVACLALGLSSGPIGTLLVLRRLSLVGDAMAHALLPGAAVAFVFAGFSLAAMSAGSFVAAMLVAGLAGLVSHFTPQREDASFAAFYLIALAAGVMIISTHGSSVDLMHVLFGSILAVDDAALYLIAGVTSVTLLTLAIVYRPLIADCLDPQFLRSLNLNGHFFHLLFLMLVVLNLVGGFHALGTLMAVGLMMLPATAARFWAGQVWSLCATASAFALLSALGGLLLSYHRNLPSGPAVVLCAGGCYGVSILFGPRGGLLRYPFARHSH